MTNPLSRVLELLDYRGSRTHTILPTGKDQTVYIIGGGETFDTDEQFILWLREFELREPKHTPSWKSWLVNRLVAHEARVRRLSMPNTMNAQYIEWEIMAEKYLAQTPPHHSLTLVGHSLGAMFLLKFLASRPELVARCRSIHLVAPAFENAYSFAIMRNQLPNNSKYFWYQSTDDMVVTYANSSFKVAREMGLSENNYLEFGDRGHFLDGEFGEVYTNIIAHF